MKCLLKFLIEYWCYGPTERSNLTLKIEYDEEKIKKDGFFRLNLTSWDTPAARNLMDVIDYEVVEGKKRIPGVFRIYQNGPIGNKVVGLEMITECAWAIFLGFEPLPEEEPKQE